MKWGDPSLGSNSDLWEMGEMGEMVSGKWYFSGPLSSFGRSSSSLALILMQYSLTTHVFKRVGVSHGQASIMLSFTTSPGWSGFILRLRNGVVEQLSTCVGKRDSQSKGCLKERSNHKHSRPSTTQPRRVRPETRGP